MKEKVRCRATTTHGRRCRTLTDEVRVWGAKSWPCCKRHPQWFWERLRPVGARGPNPYEAAESEAKAAMLREKEAAMAKDRSLRSCKALVTYKDGKMAVVEYKLEGGLTFGLEEMREWVLEDDRVRSVKFLPAGKRKADSGG